MQAFFVKNPVLINWILVVVLFTFYTKLLLKIKKAPRLKEFLTHGARGRTRTGTVLLPTDFESVASTSFTTRASALLFYTKKNGNARYKMKFMIFIFLIILTALSLEETNLIENL